MLLLLSVVVLAKPRLRGLRWADWLGCDKYLRLRTGNDEPHHGGGKAGIHTVFLEALQLSKLIDLLCRLADQVSTERGFLFVARNWADVPDVAKAGNRLNAIISSCSVVRFVKASLHTGNGLCNNYLEVNNTEIHHLNSTSLSHDVSLTPVRRERHFLGAAIGEVYDEFVHDASPI